MGPWPGRKCCFVLKKKGSEGSRRREERARARKGQGRGRQRRGQRAWTRKGAGGGAKRRRASDREGTQGQGRGRRHRAPRQVQAAPGGGMEREGQRAPPARERRRGSPAGGGPSGAVHPPVGCRHTTPTTTITSPSTTSTPPWGPWSPPNPPTTKFARAELPCATPPPRHGSYGLNRRGWPPPRRRKSPERSRRGGPSPPQHRNPKPSQRGESQRPRALPGPGYEIRTPSPTPWGRDPPGGAVGAGVAELGHLRVPEEPFVRRRVRPAGRGERGGAPGGLDGPGGPRKGPSGHHSGWVPGP